MMRKIAAVFGLRELLVTLGLGLMAGGLAIISIPLAMIVPGALLIALAVLPLIIPPRKGS